MDDFDEHILQIISENGNQASTKQIMDKLTESGIHRTKVAVIQRLDTLQKFGYIETTEGISHRGRKPLIHTIRN